MHIGSTSSLCIMQLCRSDWFNPNSWCIFALGLLGSSHSPFGEGACCLSFSVELFFVSNRDYLHPHLPFLALNTEQSQRHILDQPFRLVSFVALSSTSTSFFQLISLGYVSLRHIGPWVLARTATKPKVKKQHDRKICLKYSKSIRLHINKCSAVSKEG